MKHYSISVEDIVIGERHRALSTDGLERLAQSMREIGLRQPISVRVVDEMELHGELTSGVPVLVAGRHRLAAAKSLGWEKIDCIEVDDDQVKAEMWEIAENLHRCDLTKDQRDQHIRRYAELLESRAVLIVTQNAAQSKTVTNPKGAGRSAGIARQIADATGLSDDTVRRALNPAPRVQRAEPPKEVFDVHEQTRRRMMSAWNGATDDDRQWFRDWIDTPVMDGRAA